MTADARKQPGWVLTMAAVQPGNTASIPVKRLPGGFTEPKWFESEHTLTFVWSDGRREVWSWANLLSAEYTPPTVGVADTLDLAPRLRDADAAASLVHDYIFTRGGVTQQQASDAIWKIHDILGPLFGNDPAGR